MNRLKKEQHLKRLETKRSICKAFREFCKKEGLPLVRITYSQRDDPFFFPVFQAGGEEVTYQHDITSAKESLSSFYAGDYILYEGELYHVFRTENEEDALSLEKLLVQIQQMKSKGELKWKTKNLK